MFDIISPWTIGRFRDATSYEQFEQTRLKPDMTYAAEHGLEYLPIIFPGASAHNLMASESRPAPQEMNHIPRECGRFLWRQAAGARSLGARMLYISPCSGRGRRRNGDIQTRSPLGDCQPSRHRLPSTTIAPVASGLVSPPCGINFAHVEGAGRRTASVSAVNTEHHEEMRRISCPEPRRLVFFPGHGDQAQARAAAVRWRISRRPRSQEKQGALIKYQLTVAKLPWPRTSTTSQLQGHADQRGQLAAGGFIDQQTQRGPRRRTRSCDMMPTSLQVIEKASAS